MTTTDDDDLCEWKKTQIEKGVGSAYLREVAGVSGSGETQRAGEGGGGEGVFKVARGCGGVGRQLVERGRAARSRNAGRGR
jgi:hypothetical protein